MQNDASVGAADPYQVTLHQQRTISWRGLGKIADMRLVRLAGNHRDRLHAPTAFPHV
ncbi:hypothetical protein [Actinopolymorpha alba]|uniref:hypothetical protein n=1 Tax=Actinopolymorpha alba TaxID=533267 RepID=UPI0003803DFF|nr:hypothetical protein [Actinopolymorpha alba]